MNVEQGQVERSAFSIQHSALRDRLLALYDALYAHFGHEPHWWPIHSDSPQLEILIGAVLVQQTRWETVEAAVLRLRDAGLLAPAALAAADTASLAALIRPCAFHGQKAPGLQAIARHILARYGGDLAALLAQERAPLRAELLSLPRIGRETADTIMLYAGGHPVFVVDAYTRRLFARLDLQPGFDFTRARYDAIQQLIEGALNPWPTRRQADRETGRQADKRSGIISLSPGPPVSLSEFFWNLHALIVEECIHHCLASSPRHDRPGAQRLFVDPRKCAAHCLECGGCPLREICATYDDR
ncbi:MAG: DNA repair protein [Kouleothrix sp.]|nr:DNA repair protein [Kouleothrix sp.]